MWQLTQNCLMFSKQPSLRHFAVIRRIRRTIFGSLWLVNDRREIGRENLLFAPNRVLAWPLLFSRASDFNPSPVKLRTGRASLLFERNTDVKRLCRAICKTGFTPLKLDPIEGFKKTRRNLVYPGTITICTIVLAVMLSPKPSSSSVITDTRTAVCQSVLKEGMKLEAKNIHQGWIVISGEKLLVKVTSGFGGLRNVEVIRLCDRKTFHYTAWKNSHGLVVAKKS